MRNDMVAFRSNGNTSIDFKVEALVGMLQPYLRQFEHASMPVPGDLSEIGIILTENPEGKKLFMANFGPIGAPPSVRFFEFYQGEATSIRLKPGGFAEWNYLEMLRGFAEAFDEEIARRANGDEHISRLQARRDLLGDLIIAETYRRGNS